MINEEEIPVNEERRPIIAGKQLDIEAYAKQYSGRNKINRLLFIAEKCVFRHMELKALRMAYEEIKNGEDTNLFREVVAKIGGRLGEECGPDDVWADATDQRAEELEAKLREYIIRIFRTATIPLSRERFGQCYIDLGDFYYTRGQLVKAFRNYEYARGYCTAPELIVDRCLDVILVYIEMGKFSHVTPYVHCAEQSPDGLSPILIEKLCCALGLVHLENREYKLAALKFVETSSLIGLTFAEVIVPRDIAIYGGLCALASFNRAELQSSVINNVGFQEILELVPDIRELIHYFCAREYASFFERLGILKEHLLLDIHFHDHVEYLYEQIRKKLLIEYTIPLPNTTPLCLRKMANDFKTNVKGLVEELAVLIENKQILGHIDSQNGVFTMQIGTSSSSSIKMARSYLIFRM